MPNISSFSTLTSMLQTSNLVCQSVQLANELKISLEYDTSRGLLNIFVKNTDRNVQFPLHINVLSNTSDDCQLTRSNHNEYLPCSSNAQQDLQDEITDISFREEDEPKICIELSNIYVYDLFDENENDLRQTMIASSTLVSSSSSSSSTSSSCFDEQTIDNDDGYSTHSLDDIDQQCLSMSSSKMLIPFVPYQHPEDPISSSIPRLIDQLMWLSPFKKTVKQMINNHLLI